MSIQELKPKILELLAQNRDGLPTYELHQVCKIPDNLKVVGCMSLDMSLNLNENKTLVSLGFFEGELYKAILELSKEKQIYFRQPAKMTKLELFTLYQTASWGQDAILFENTVFTCDLKEIAKATKKGKDVLFPSFVHLMDDTLHKNIDNAFYMELKDDGKYSIKWFN